MFRKLRAKMTELGIDQAYIAKKLHIGIMTVSRSMTGKREWQLAEMYAILDLIREPYEKLHEYFPKNGKVAA